MAISNRDIVEKQPVVLDPNFFLPPNVVDVRYINDQDTAGFYGSDTVDDSDETVLEDPIVDPDDGTTTPNVIDAPTTMTIISQTVRVNPDGAFVVDVVIEVEDIPGIANYDVRLTKV